MSREMMRLLCASTVVSYFFEREATPTVQFVGLLVRYVPIPSQSALFFSVSKSLYNSRSL